MRTGGGDTEDEGRAGYGQRREAWEEPAPPPPHLGLRLPAARAVCTHACVYGGGGAQLGHVAPPLTPGLPL